MLQCNILRKVVGLKQINLSEIDKFPFRYKFATNVWNQLQNETTQKVKIKQRYFVELRMYFKESDRVCRYNIQSYGPGS